MTLPIACVQMACSSFDPRFNLDKADHFIREASQLGARLILFPEFLTTGCTYDRRLHDFAEPIGGTTTRWMQRRSNRTGSSIGAGIVEKADDGIFDTFLLTGPAGEVQFYRKRYPTIFERFYFHRGDKIGILHTALGRLGVMICWDMVHANLCREMLDQIDLLLICSAWPDVREGNIPLFGIRGWLGRQPEQRPPRLAKKLQVPVAYCNMTGPFVTRVPWLGLTYRSPFTGASSISDGAGNTLTSAGTQETMLLADVHLWQDGQRKAV